MDFALGTWVLGGMFQRGIDENEAISTIHAALDRGVRWIDTAPLYGFGRTEELVGKAIRQYPERGALALATKCGLGWKDGKIFRDARKESLMRELDSSLSRLGIDCIDLYQLHWPDPLVPVAEIADTFREMKRQGKVRAIGLSNFSRDEIIDFERHLLVQAVQLPFNLFEHDIGDALLPICKPRKMLVLGYSALCRGLLTGMLKKGMSFQSDDLRSFDPKFEEPRFSQYLDCVKKLAAWAKEKHRVSIIDLAFRWLLDRGVTPLWGPKDRRELIDLERLKNWSLSLSDFQEIDQIVREGIPEPIGTEFLAPPCRGS